MRIVSDWGDEKVLEWMVLMVSQQCDRVQCPELHFRMVIFVLCYFTKLKKKKKKEVSRWTNEMSNCNCRRRCPESPVPGFPPLGHRRDFIPQHPLVECGHMDSGHWWHVTLHWSALALWWLCNEVDNLWIQMTWAAQTSCPGKSAQAEQRTCRGQCILVLH